MTTNDYQQQTNLDSMKMKPSLTNANFKKGWNYVKEMNVKEIENILKYVELDNGTTVDKAEYSLSQDYYAPTGGTWNPSPLSITAEPTIDIANPSFTGDQAIKVEILNSMTKMSNLNAPPPFNNLLFLLGNNKAQYNYINKIDIDLGGSNYDSMQIGIFENSLTSGNSRGNVGVYDVQNGPFTGTNTLSLILSGETRFVNLGIRLESSTNQSSILYMPTVILNETDIDQKDYNPEDDGDGNPIALSWWRTWLAEFLVEEGVRRLKDARFPPLDPSKKSIYWGPKY